MFPNSSVHCEVPDIEHTILYYVHLTPILCPYMMYPFSRLF